MKKGNFDKFLNNLVQDLDEISQEKVKSFWNTLPDDFSISKKKRHTKVYAKMTKYNVENIDQTYIDYFSTKSMTKKYSLIDESLALKYKNKLKQRPKQLRENLIFCPEYWIKKGFTYEEAKEKISQYQRENQKKSVISARNNNSYKKRLNPMSLKYWTSKGYTTEEAECLRTPFVERAVSAIQKSKLIEKHGHTKGIEIFKAIVAKKQATMLLKYGSSSPLNGSVSKESLKFFVPLYKKLRKLGIKKEDIYWGIGGSKEFATNFNGKNYFYDFTIKSLKYIVEYNNTFWHYRENTEWNNPYIDKESSKNKDEIKHQAMVSREFSIRYVWNDESFEQRIDEIYQEIKLKIEEKIHEN